MVPLWQIVARGATTPFRVFDTKGRTKIVVNMPFNPRPPLQGAAVVPNVKTLHRVHNASVGDVTGLSFGSEDLVEMEDLVVCYTVSVAHHLTESSS